MFLSQEENLAMLVDFYEFTMANGYLEHGMGDRIACFDMFFRNVPDGGGFAIAAGLEQVIAYLKNLHFSESDIAVLEEKNLFCKEFLDYLRNFKFVCDVWAIPEGTPIFPREPILKVKGPVIQAQLVETVILLTVNHQSLIATKANRIVRAAKGRPVMEFGGRRAQGYSGSLMGSRAAYIGGCAGTACTISQKLFGIPALGTMAHSWVQMFDTELDAFRAYAQTYPADCTLLVDTYNVLKSGIPNAIRVFNEELVPKGYRPKGVRIDSGDIAYLSKKMRKMLDEAGFPDCGIVASNSLDEYIIEDMWSQGAPISSFGVGERLITSSSEPVFGGVYKLVAVEDENGNEIPKIKISENPEKVTVPCSKRVIRFFEKDSKKAIADLLVLEDEVIDEHQPYELFSPEYVWKRKTITDFTAVELLKPIFVKGECVYESPGLHEIKQYCAEQIETLWDEVKRFENPHAYYVDFSQKLWDVRERLLHPKRED